MSLRHDFYAHGTTVHALLSYEDLVAVGGEHTLSVLQVDSTGWVDVASFFLGTPVVAITFAPTTVSPSQDKTSWRVQLAVACADGHIRRLTQSGTNSEPDIELISDGASTHHGPVTALAFSGASAGRYLASSSLDRTLLVWDLDGLTHGPAAPYAHQFAHPLLSVVGHARMAEFIVADDAGSVFLFDWANTGRAPVHLIDPRALADARTAGKLARGTGGAAWKPSDRDVVGATFGSRWVVWQLGEGSNSKPLVTGNGFLEGGHRFRWSPSDPNVFAISTLSPLHGANVHVFHAAFPGAAPYPVDLPGRPNHVHDFDFVAGLGLAVAIGRRVHFVTLPQEVVALTE